MLTHAKALVIDSWQISDICPPNGTLPLSKPDLLCRLALTAIGKFLLITGMVGKLWQYLRRRRGAYVIDAK